MESLSKSLSPEQVKELGLPSSGSLEISKLEEKTWVLSLPNSQTNLTHKTEFKITPLHQKVLRLLKTHKLPDLIEGRFEKLLSGEELTAFEELKNVGKVVCIKTNPKFEKGIYREVKAGESVLVQANSLPTPVQEKPMEEYTLVHDGFMVLRSDGAAKAASFDLADRIKQGEVKGIKSFDGFYYIIENSLLEKYSALIVKVVQAKKKIELPALAQEVQLPMVLVRMVLEFSKEDGDIIEKQKNVFAWVG